MIITITSAASVADSTNLVLFNGPTISDSRAYAYNRWDLLTLDPAFDPCRPTAFYVHGYNQNTSAPAFQTLVKAYNIRGSHNLVAYDWSKAANGNYITSALPNVVTVSCTKKPWKKSKIPRNHFNELPTIFFYSKNFVSWATQWEELY